MEKRILGRTGIEVSRLCFGSLTMTPFQANLSIKEGAELITYAYKKGINFIDTAEIYENYEYIKEALKEIPRDDFVIATKTYAYTKELAKESLEKALKGLNVNYIDIFLLHEQESEHTIRGHFEALKYLLEEKKAGRIRAVGISTHKVEGALAINKYPQLDIIHPIVNKDGIGILDGTLEEMLSALEDLHKKGIGIYGMKPLGGGHLITRTEEALSFVFEKTYLDSIAIGMQSVDEVDANIEMLENGYINKKTSENLRKKDRKLIVHDYCIGCGNCVTRCQHGGITLVDNIAKPNENCILCGYCATVCPEFCIKVI